MEKEEDKIMLTGRKYGFITFCMLLCFIFVLSGTSGMAFAGEKKKIAVISFDNHSRVYGLEEGVTDMMVVELVKNKNYEVVEREQLRRVLAEQRLGATGVIDGQTAARLGEVMGINYLVVGAVSEAGVSQVTHLWTETKVRVGLSMRLIDTSTGSIVLAENALGEVSKGGLVDQYGKVVVGETANVGLYTEAANRAVGRLVNKINEVNPLEGCIIQINAKKVYIDLGREQGVQPGQKFEIFREGNVIVHPISGKIMGVEKSKLGNIKIISVDGDMGIGEAQEGSLLSMVHPGDKVRKITE